MKNINETELKVFKTRWAMSYLKGPMSKNDIKFLMKDRKELIETDSVAPKVQTDNPAKKANKPIISNELEQFYSYESQKDSYDLQPYLLISSTINFFNASKNINMQNEYTYKIYLDERDKDINFEEKEPLHVSNFLSKPKLNSNYYALPSYVLNLQSFKSLKKEVNDYFYYNNELVLYKEPSLNLLSKQNETLEDFKIRVKDRLNEKIDEGVEELKEKY